MDNKQQLLRDASVKTNSRAYCGRPWESEHYLYKISQRTKEIRYFTDGLAILQ